MLDLLTSIPLWAFLAGWFAAIGAWWLGAALARWRYYRLLGTGLPSWDPAFLGALAVGIAALTLAGLILLDDRYPRLVGWLYRL